MLSREVQESAMFVEWSTEAVSPARRFEGWREVCSQQVYALTSEWRNREPFKGRMQLHRAGALDVADVRCDGHLVQRRPRDISACPSDTYYIYLQLQGHAWFEQGGSRHVAGPGDIIIADPNIAFSTGTDNTFDFRLWRLKRAHLEPLLALRASVLPMIKVSGSHGEGALINSWLDGLLRNYTALSGGGLDLAFGTLCALVANVAGLAPEMRDHGRLGRRAALLHRVLRQIELRATDPDLSPGAMADEFALSLRALHQLFELSDRTFHECLTQVRLAKAHALLHDPASTGLSTAEIGFAAGFRETSTFYRRFKARYGAPPGDFRPG
ncbi:MAG: helix-turn-helix domain-containing protein [Rhodoferax sp.]|nr:helix-turn-helix domain-containing protein [Rhodoferax sp.]